MNQSMTRTRNECALSGDRLLLDELTHRVNNEISAAVGLIAVAARRAIGYEAENVLLRLQRQLLDFARVLHALRAPNVRTAMDVSSYVRELCDAISDSRLGSGGIGLELALDPVQLDSDRCWRLGLILSELVSNCAKHAFAGRFGEIRIELAMHGSIIRCVVSDNGGAVAPVSRGRGLNIVEALVCDLEGRLHQYFGPSGSVSTVEFSVHRSPDLSVPCQL